MSELARDELLELAEERQGLSVSIYMPTAQAGREVMEGPIRFKNLLTRAEALLTESGMRAAEARALIAPGWELRDDADFWQHQDEGLAVFIASGLMRHYRTTRDFPEMVVVGERFHIKPLLPLLTGAGRFYILALSENEVRLLAADRGGATQLELGDDVPTSLEEALAYDDPERSDQFHTRTDSPISADIRGSIHYGTGAAADEDDDEVRRFLLKVDDGVSGMLEGQERPLVLAGVEELLSIYRQVTDYRHVVDAAITGNQKLESDAELHGKAWRLVEPIFAEDERTAREVYAIQAGRGEPMDSLEDVLNAAHDGRIGTLFVPLEVQRWGQYDPGTRRVEVHEGRRPGDQDLLDLAAVQTLANAGTVYAVPADALPGSGEVAGVVRY